jgi:hypothetical protein
VLSAVSAGSVLSFGSVASAGSLLSFGSAGSILSIGSSGSILSIGSSGSILSVGRSGAYLDDDVVQGEQGELARAAGAAHLLGKTLAVAGLLAAVTTRR